MAACMLVSRNRFTLFTGVSSKAVIATWSLNISIKLFEPKTDLNLKGDHCMEFQDC